VLIIVGVVALACVLLTAGGVVVGGAVYALARSRDWLGPLSDEISLALPSQKAPDDDGRTIINVPAAVDQEEEGGIVVASVVDDGPADAAGVKRGDILLELDGVAINSYTDLRQALERLAPGDEAELRVLHGDDERRLTATLDERDGHAFLGMVPCCVMRADDITLGMPQRIPAGGAMIADVVDDSPADEAGLEAGDILLAVDGQELGDELSLADAIRGHQPGDRVTLTVWSSTDEGEREVRVELGEHPDDEGVAYLGVTYLHASASRMSRFPLPDDWSPSPHTEPFRYALPEALVEVVVIQVTTDSPAEEAGLRDGDIVLTIDGEPVKAPQNVVDAVTDRQPGDELTLTIRRAGEDDDRDQEQELQLSVTLGEHPDDEDRAYLGIRLGLRAVYHRRFGGESDPEGWFPRFLLPEDWRSELGLPEEWHWEFQPPGRWNLPFGLDELPEDLEFDFGPRRREDEPKAFPGIGSA
jgi:S1-C subfamily serine protease